MIFEFLQAEEGCYLSYVNAIARSSDPETRRRLEDFAAETTIHMKLLENAARALGGKFGHLSSQSALWEKRSLFMLTLKAPVDLVEIVAFESLMLAETQVQHHWQVIQQMLPLIDEPSVRLVLKSVFSEKQFNPGVRLDQIRQYLTEMMLRRLVTPIARSMAA